MYRKEKDRGRADSRFEGKGRGELDKAGGKTKRKGMGEKKEDIHLFVFLTFEDPFRFFPGNYAIGSVGTPRN